MRTVGEIRTTYKKNVDLRYGDLEHNAGWNDLVYETIGRLVEVQPDIVIPIIKEKYGTLNIQTFTHLNAEAEQIIKEAEIKSCSICEICGKEGEHISKNGVYMVRCITHQ